MSNKTTVISASSVGFAWAQVFNLAMDTKGGEAGPLVLEVIPPDGNVLDDPAIRGFVDDQLRQQKKFSVSTTSFLIFPWELWTMLKRPDLTRLTDVYLKKIYPALKKRGPKHNSHGTYFQRMVQFSGVNETVRNGRVGKDVNQLQRILEIWRQAEDKGRHPRHSALQATIFDPAKDHHGAALCGFPCLQQVSFNYHADQLTVNAYYPTQYIFDRAYGNYLGLCHLGVFMAVQMGLTFAGLACFIGKCHLGSGVTKALLTPLQRRIGAHLSSVTSDKLLHQENSR